MWRAGRYTAAVADSYTTLFSVRPASGQSTSDLLRHLASDIVDWARRPDGVDLTIDPGWYSEAESGHEVEIQADACADGEYWQLRWSHPDGDGRPVSWASDLRLATALSASEVEVFAEVRVVSDPSAATAEPVNVGTPRLVRDIIDRYDACTGDRPLRISAMSVGVADAQRFVQQHVLAANRVLPILAISPRAEDNRPYLTAQQVQRAGFGGLAEVCFLETAATTRNVSDWLGQDFALLQRGTSDLVAEDRSRKRRSPRPPSLAASTCRREPNESAQSDIQLGL